ncbi:hypothetical protein FBUS_07996 [Fasciolopsis buskii]|uniref:Letm1 RBD domain-containing protein n=1 Tax=Fasciolopsis buskii TaxID=27845 RepID=A0A8E0VEP0_9TREM|nr:hypothetical protein FBUS_07996 [Fasciolopsis buski]
MWLDDSIRTVNYYQYDVVQTLEMRLITFAANSYHVLSVPQDVLRAAPLMLLAPLPGTFLLYPLFFAYPRLFLTRQFWTGEQRAQFDQAKLDRRMSILPDLILTDLHNHVTNLKSDRNTSALVLQHSYLFQSVYEQIKSGVKPSTENLIQLIPLFNGPLALEKLPRSSVVNLCMLHDLTFRTSTRQSSSRLAAELLTLVEPRHMHSRRLRRLHVRSHLLLVEDRLLLHDFTEPNGSFNLNKDECLATCFLRGIDPFQTDANEVMERLRSWVACSLADSGKHLLLHSPFSNASDSKPFLSCEWGLPNHRSYNASWSIPSSNCIHVLCLP